MLRPVVFLLLVMAPWPSLIADSSTDQNSWRRELLAWRTHRAESLQAPEGWLSLVALEWLNEGDNSFGSAPDSRIQLAGKAQAHVGIVHLEKGSVRLLPPVGGFPKELQI